MWSSAQRPSPGRGRVGRKGRSGRSALEFLQGWCALPVNPACWSASGKRQLRYEPRTRAVCGTRSASKTGCSGVYILVWPGGRGAPARPFAPQSSLRHKGLAERAWATDSCAPCPPRRRVVRVHNTVYSGVNTESWARRHGVILAENPVLDGQGFVCLGWSIHSATGCVYMY